MMRAFSSSLPTPRISRFASAALLGFASTLLLGSGTIARAANFNPSTDFIAADSNRDTPAVATPYMDVAGVWNGATDVTNTTGDTFTLTLPNTGATAFDLSPSVTLPPGFEYVTGTASTSGPVVVVNQVGSVLNFVLDGGEFDLTNGNTLTIDFGLRANASVSAGTYQLAYQYTYGDNENDGSPTLEGLAQNVLVQEGASLLAKLPANQTAGVNETANWTVSVTNSGFGGLFDVEVDESSLLGNGNFTSVTITQTAPALAAVESPPGSGVYVLPYLAPGEVLSFTVEATVSGCSDLGNTVATDDRTGNTSKSREGAVTLDLDLPLLTFNPPGITLDYLVPTNVTIPVSNLAGSGPAVGVVIDSNLDQLPITVSAVSANYNYNASNGEFTLVANGGDIANGASEDISFTVVSNDVCAGAGAGSIVWQAFYDNECGDPYQVPFSLSSVNPPSGQPGVSISVDDGGIFRLANNELGTFTLTAGASQLARIQSDPISVDFTLAGAVTVLAVQSPSAGSIVNNGGGSYSWTIDKADLGSNPTVDVDFQVDSDPCLGGSRVDVSANISATSVITADGGTCPLADSGSDGFFITNNPGAFASQFYNVTGSTFEAGSPTADGTRDIGEGEFIPFTAEYEFGGAYPGEWIGSTYDDDFGGDANQQVVPGSVTITYDDGGGPIGPVPVPPASVQQTVGGLAIDLDFLETAAFFDDNTVAGKTITFNYSTTVPDSSLSGNSRGYLNTTILRLSAPTTGTGACADMGDAIFTQVVGYTVERAVATLGLGMPAQLDVCEEFDAVISLDNANSQEISNVLLTLDTSNADYEYITGQTPAYGGVFNAGNITYSENGGNDPTFEFTGGDLPGNGTITVRMRRAATSGTDTTGISVDVDYDDFQTSPSASRDFSGSAGASPNFVFTAELVLTVTPNSRIQLSDSFAQWDIIVQNLQPGVAYGATLVDNLPPHFQLDVAATNAANAFTANVSGVPTTGQSVSFDLGDMAAGDSETLTIIAQVLPSSNCVVNDGDNEVIATWGCDGNAQIESTFAPDFKFGEGGLQVVHDTTNSVASLCANGEVRIRVKNTGDGAVTDVEVFEVMDPGITGLSIVPGTVSYATDNAPASFTPVAGNPTGAGTASNPFTFDSTLIPVLADLVTVNDDTGSTVNEVTIRFTITVSDPNLFAGNIPGPSLTASGTADLFCGSVVNSPGVPFILPTIKPDINTSLQIDNTLLPGGFGESDVGATGQTIDWRYTITNTGNATAENVRIRVPLSGSGGTAVISGDVPSPGAYAGGWVATNDVPDGGSIIVTVTETLGANCVNATSTAEVTWGCTDPGATSPNVVDQPTDNDDPAQLFMSPDFDDNGGSMSASFSSDLNNGDGRSGRGRVTVTMDNAGAQANNMSITVDLPTNTILDNSVPASFTSNNSSLTAVAWDGVSTTDPVFELTGFVENNEDFTFEFFVVSTIDDATRGASFPDLADEEETSNSLDPGPNFNLGGNNRQVTANFQNLCGDPLNEATTVNIDPRQPDIDINFAVNNGSVSDAVLNRVVLAGQPETFNVFLRNEGEGGSSADNNDVTVTLGAGWTSGSVSITDAGRGGSTVTTTGVGNVFTLSAADIGRIRTGNGDEVDIQITATPTGVAGDSLSVRIDVDGEQLDASGNGTGRFYSRDSRAFRCIGVSIDKSYVNASTTESGTSAERDTLIGEEASFDISVGFFGAEGGSSIQNLVVRDTLGNSGAANKGLGLVSIDTSASEIAPASVTTTPANLDTLDPVQNGVIDFNLGTLTPPLADGSNEFLATIVARTLNDANTSAVNSDNKQLFNNLGISFDYQGLTFVSNDSNDGFSSGTEIAGLHADDFVRVQRPTISIDKQARNATDGGSFANTATGEATDIFEFRVRITNNDSSTATVPLYDLNLTDTIEGNGKLALLDSTTSPAFQPGADVDDDGTIDVAMVGGVTPGTNGQLVIDSTNLPIGDLGSDLVRLDPGEFIDIIYRAQAQLNVTPSEELTDPVTVNADTLPGASGSQSVRQGTTGDDDGAAVISDTDDPGVTITVDPISQTKAISTTSVGGDMSANVLIGEQVEFQVSILLPQGTAPALSIQDSLSTEFELLSIGTVTIGSSVAATNNPPTITPAPGTLPANGTPLNLDWDFGTTVVSAGTDAERSIVVTYIVQVRNLDGLGDGDTITNSAQYSFTGAPVDIADVDLTVRESDVTVSKEVSPASPALVDAGDELTFTITIDNDGGNAPAYDIAIVDTLPAGLIYKVNSTTVLSGAGETLGLTGTLGEPDESSGVLTWGRLQTVPVNLDLAATNGKLVFTYQATVDDTVEPDQELVNSAVVTWSSLDGDPGPDLGTAVGTAGDANGERTGSGTTPNDLTDTQTTTTTVDKASSVSKTASGFTLPLDAPADGFRIGDVVTYTLEIEVMEGTHEEFEIIDDLPAGMAFESFDAITPTSGNDGFTFTAIIAGTTAPQLGDTGTLTFDLGTLVNAGDALSDNDTLTLVYRARVTDDAVNVETPDGDDSASTDTTEDFDNSAKLSFLEADDDTFETSTSTDTITVEQPELTVDKERLLPAANNRLGAGDSGRFRYSVTNSGNGPAYNAEVVDTLPVGMRATTPTIVSALLDGSDISGSLSTNYTSGTGEFTITLSDAQVLEPGETLVIDYNFTIDTNATGNTTISNSVDVTEHFSKPSSDTTDRRSYDNVTPDSEDIFVFVTVQGTIFEDDNANRFLNAGENWNNGITVFANLIQGGSVIDSLQIDPGTGDFRFDDVSAGNYSIIVTDSAINNTPVEPTDWIFFETPPTDGSIDLTVANQSLFNQNLGLIQGSFLEGVVFEDTGVGSGTANNGTRDGSEPGIANVFIRLTDCSGTVYDEVQTNGEGEFTLFVPVTVANGATICVEEFNPASYISTGGDEGTTGGSYDRASDVITFTHQRGVSHDSLEFGDVPPNSFLTDGEQTILPGNVAFYSHTFIAGTGGEVSFDLSNTLNPSYPGWGQTLFRDTNCNGALDDGEPLIAYPTAPITIAADDQVCLIVKDSSPSGAPFGSTNQILVTANFTYTNASPVLPNDVLTRNDLTRIGPGSTAGLELAKAVDKAIASPGETITYTITYTNNGQGDLRDIIIYDNTPAYTNFQSAAAGSFPNALTAVVITDPGMGNTGAIVWTFTGTLAPGSEGTVSYEVNVDE